MYRVLSEAEELKDRRNQRRHPQYVKPIVQATAPKQLWSWDITRLPAEIKGKYYFLYAMIDVYSRYVVGWMITHEENSDRAQHFIRETLRQQGIEDKVQLTIHSDRGSPMTASNTVELLAVLGLACICTDGPSPEQDYRFWIQHNQHSIRGQGQKYHVCHNRRACFPIAAENTRFSILMTLQPEIAEVDV
ncbi:MAG: transposase family protein [Pseudobdellovibrionaceae bacterium]|nr:transposase family protein [Pseudobdellovibrionaceae bacterium]